MIILKKRRTSAFLLFAIFFLPFLDSVSACTIFTASNGQSVFFAGNEDNNEGFQWRIWFFPSTKEKYGRVFLRFRVANNLDIAVAGLNDQGLAIDLNIVHFPSITNHPDRDDYHGTIFMKWLADYATVTEVKENLYLYDLLNLEAQPDQIHVADKTGNAAVIGINPNGELCATNITGNF